MRALYSLAMWLLQPFLRAKLRRRAVAEPGYALAVDERFGYYWGSAADQQSGYIWVHAVSLGETTAAAVLIAELRQRLPHMRLLLTHGTATGREEGLKLLQPGDVQAWAPWDTPGAVSRYLTHFSPRIGILMETEVWPNLCALCKARSIPLVLANARLSEKSLKQSQRLAWLAGPAYRSLAAVWAQTPDDAARLQALGAPVQGVLGNLKFDAEPNAALLARGQAWAQQAARPVVMFASSREGEEAALLAILEENRAIAVVDIAHTAITKIANESPRVAAMPAASAAIQWLIVPRHPQRFDAVAALITAHGFAVSRRSQWGEGPPSGDGSVDLASGARGDVVGAAPPKIWLGDSLGEMPLYYGLAQVALLGGSFEPLGGQNLIEAAACACPVVMGPHTFNFAQASELAEAAGAALRGSDLQQGVATAAHLVGDGAARQAAQNACASFLQPHRGAAKRLADAIVSALQ